MMPTFRSTNELNLRLAESELLLTDNNRRAMLGGKRTANDLQVLTGGIRGRDTEIGHVLQYKDGCSNKVPLTNTKSPISLFPPLSPAEPLVRGKPQSAFGCHHPAPHG